MFDAITYALSKAFTKKAIEEADAGNMKIEDYDSEGNGVVNDSRRLGGNLPAYYASTASVVGKMDKSVYDSNDNGIVDNAEKVNNHTVASDVPANAEFTDTKNLSDLQDTDFNNLADGETLIWDATNSKWVNSTISGGGSTITLTTTTEQGEAVTMTIAGVTYSGTFSAQGICKFEDIKETGVAIFSSGSAFGVLNVEYFGNYTVELKTSGIFGVEWDGTETSLLTRTDDAMLFTDPVPYYAGMTETPSSLFDNISPWKDMEIVEDPEAGTLVKIPKFWFYIDGGDGSPMTIKISNVEQTDAGWLVSPAHMDRGDGKGERDYVYIGRYHCADGTYKSTTGVIPQVSQTFATFRSSISNLGSTIWQSDFATRMTIWLLYIVEFANWDSQTTIGGGNDTGTNGQTDNMPYHTGTTADGRGWSKSGFTQYRNIEGLWDNRADWLDGIAISSGTIYITLDPSRFGSTSSTYRKNVGSAYTTSGYITRWKRSTVSGYTWFMFPSGVTGDRNNSSYTGYIPDYYNYYNSSSGVLHVGNDSHAFGGLFNFYIYSTNASSGTTSRLMKLP